MNNKEHVLMVVVGRTGSGKTSLITKLCERGGYKQLISQTTRQRRNDNDNDHVFVTEEDYNYLFAELHRLLGEYDDYLEVFDDNMQYSEAPVVHSIAEKTCDIYQDLKNFISSYRCGVLEVMDEALWQLNNNFELYWGKACAELLRAVHQVVYKETDDEE